jgi:hypothetical protein
MYLKEMTIMSYDETIQTLAFDPAQLEKTYQAALQDGDADAFRQAITNNYAKQPGNLLYAAWFHRLRVAAVQVHEHVIAWAWVLPLALANGFIFWVLSDERFMVPITQFGGDSFGYLPTIVLLAGPIAATVVLIYLTAVGHGRWPLSLLISLALFAAAAYVLWVYPQMGTIPYQEQYLNLMAAHLLLLSWAGVGLFLLSSRRDPAGRFAFLIKSLEVFIVGGLFVIAGGLFTAITAGLFGALDITLPDAVLRAFLAGGLGLIPIIATAVIYDPTLPPAAQSFDEGLSKLVALLMRVMLPLTLIVLLVYLAFIPFNFRAPFDNRDVLIIYNGMLFAVVALLVGATPRTLADVSPRLAPWLRRGIIAVAALALIISLYALAAMLYRTGIDRLTPNRLAFIGWNVINIALLALLLIRQARAKEGEWVHDLQRAYSSGAVAYAAWALVVILALPWLFGIKQGQVETLPLSVQRVVYERPDPVLFLCTGSPHIYLLEDGQKRWVDTIATFEARGYVWGDVHRIPCDDLRAIPDGTPIPPDAGPPPQP